MSDPFSSHMSSANTLDLRLGQPKFLHSFWDKGFLYQQDSIPSDIDVLYPPESAYVPLEILVRQLHKNVGNIDPSDKYMVVGAGATQLLHAIIATLRNRGKNSVFAKAPYWPRFRDISLSAGVIFTSNSETHDIRIQTTPNNPDLDWGMSLEKKSSVTYIHDLNYNWPTYGGIVKHLDEDISIFGMSKLTGHAGLRVGWAFFKDGDLAQAVAHEIELQTSGVSLQAQHRAACLIDEINKKTNTDTCIFRYGHNILSQRWKYINHALRTIDPNIQFRSQKGMFVYAKSPAMIHILDSLDIAYISGDSTGETKQSSEYFRINIGCSNDEFEEFKKRIGFYLETK